MGKTWLILLETLLITDTAILVGYRHIVRSSYLFITAQTVFYPLIAVNIIMALMVLAAVIRSFIRPKR